MKYTYLLLVFLSTTILNGQAYESQTQQEILKELSEGKITVYEAELKMKWLGKKPKEKSEEKTYNELAEEFLSSNPTDGPQALSVRGAFSWLGKAFKWLKGKEIEKMISYLINPDCKDNSKMYEEIGRHVVETQVNQYLISIGAKPIIDESN